MTIVLMRLLGLLSFNVLGIILTAKYITNPTLKMVILILIVVEEGILSGVIADD